MMIRKLHIKSSCIQVHIKSRLGNCQLLLNLGMNKYRSLQTRLNCTLSLLICSIVLMIPLASPAIFSSNESSSSFIHYSGSMVKVGDRNLSIAAWEGLMNTINCLTSIHGMWVNTTTTTAPINHVLDNNDDDVEVNGHRYRRGITHVPLYESVYSNDDALVTKVYTACGNRHRRIGLDYYWLPPPSCRQQHQLVKFSVESLCYLLRGRILLFIGDSLSLHHYETTVNAIGNRTTYGHSPSYDHYWEHYDYCVRNHWGDENFQVTYIKWNSIMEDKMELVKRMHHSSINGSVIVANWGAFYVSDSRVKQRRREIIRKFNEQLPTSLFIYRSSNMAHLNCDNYKVPDNVDHNPAPHPYKINWHW